MLGEHFSTSARLNWLYRAGSYDVFGLALLAERIADRFGLDEPGKNPDE